MIQAELKKFPASSMSLLRDSLDFLANELSQSQSSDDHADITSRIRVRAFQLRVYANTSTEDFHVEESSTLSDVSNSAKAKQHNAEKVGPQADSPTIKHVMPPIPKIYGVDDDILRNLLMSWFYAGYYTGKAEAESARFN